MLLASGSLSLVLLVGVIPIAQEATVRLPIVIVVKKGCGLFSLG